MNKAYRIIWNKARKCMMVVGENAKAQGKCSSRSKSILNAVSAALIALAGADVSFAQSSGGVIDTPTSTPQVIPNGVFLYVDGQGTNTGAITLNTGISTVSAVSNISGATISSISNDGGTISNTSSSNLSGGISIANAKITNGVTNTGSIAGFVGLAISSSTVSGGIVNSGAIATLNSSGSGLALKQSTLIGGISNTGFISGGSGLIVAYSSVSGGVNNSGSIYGAAAGLALNAARVDAIANSGTIQGGNQGIWIGTGSTVTGGLNNSGLIIGGSAGIWINGVSTVSGGLTNSGVISGSANSLRVDSTSSLSGIAIAGSNTAQFIGDVYAPNTSVSITGGSTYTLGTNFTVSGFNNGGTLVSNPGTAYTISGNNGANTTYTQGIGGVYQVGISSNSTDYGSLNVIGNANLASGTNINVRFANTNAGIVDGDVLNVLNATGTVSSTTYAVSDNSVLLNFNAANTGTQINLTATTSGACNTNVAGAVTGPCLVGFDAPNLQVESTGTITSATAGIQALPGSYSPPTVYSGFIRNDGLVVGTQYGIQVLPDTTIGGGSAYIQNSGTIIGDVGIMVNNSHLGIGIVNQGYNGAGLIVGAGGGGSGIGLDNSSLAEINNYSGTISGDTGVSVANSTIYQGISNSGGSIGGAIAGIALNGSNIGYVNNSGIVSGGSTGLSIASGSSIGGDLVNSGTITGGQYGIAIGNSQIAGLISNSGLITAQSGVLIGQSTITYGIINSGTIVAYEASGMGGSGFRFYESSVSGGLTNTGLITASGMTLPLSYSTLSGGIHNYGTITGGNGIVLQYSSVDTINNYVGGKIQGQDSGISLGLSSRVDEIYNAGIISGTNNSIWVGNDSTLGGLFIGGRNTAQFIGDVQAPNTSVVINDDSIYTLGANFNVGSFNNEGILVSAPGTTYTITGNSGTVAAYTQGSDSVYRVGVNGTATGQYGSVSVVGNAIFGTAGTASGIDVRLNNSTVGIGAGTVLGNIFSASNGITSPGFKVTDNSVLLSFAASINGNQIDVTASNSTACNTSVSGSVIGPCLVGFDAPSLTVASTGTITSTTAGIQVLAGYSNGTGINNQGTVIGSEFGLQVLSAATLVGGITNSGILAATNTTSSGNAGIGLLIDSSFISGSIVNSQSGTITGAIGAIIANTSDLFSSTNRTVVTGSIINSGLIYGVGADKLGPGLGVLNTSIGGSIVNQNSGVIAGSGIGMIVAASTLSGGIVNSGLIAGGSVGAFLIGNSIQGGISNAGTIIAYGGSGSGPFSQGIGLFLSANQIQGGILNSGLISGSNSGLIIGSELSGSGKVGITYNGISNSGFIIGEAGYGVGLIQSGLSGGINNSGTIFGSVAGLVISNSEISGRIINSGLIEGNETGLRITGVTPIEDGLTNSGIISGGINSVYIDSNHTLAIAGRNTAQFIGDVYTPNAQVTITGGSTYTMGANFTVGGFNNGGVLATAPGNAYTISGYNGSNTTYTQGSIGVYRVGVDGTAAGDYGSVAVIGNATFGTASGIDVRISTISANVGAGTVLGNIFNATNGITSSGFTVTDNSVLLNFAANVNGNQIDVIASNSNASCYGAVSTAVTGPCLVGFDAPSLTVDSIGEISGATAGIQVLAGFSNGGITNAGNVSGSQFGIQLLSGATLAGGITNSGIISSGATGIKLSSANVIGGILNINGAIYGLYDQGIVIDRYSTVDRIENDGGYISGISNAGFISGPYTGIAMRNGAVVGGINNSGTIQGTQHAIFMTKSFIDSGIINSGLMAGSATGIKLKGSGISGSVLNTGTISDGQYGLVLASSISGLARQDSFISGGLTNSGMIVGTTAGIQVNDSSTISNGINNSGVISGGIHSIDIDPAALVSNIAITGRNTAQFIGDVYAPNTPVTITGGSTYTLGANFTVGGFNNGGILVSNPGPAYTISGNNGANTTYTQGIGGVYQVGISSNSTDYGSLNVIGNANLASGTNINVRFANTNAGIVDGDVLNVLNATGTVSSTTYAVSDNSVLLNFNAANTGTQINLTATTSGACNTNVAGAVTGPCLVGFDAPNLQVESTGTITSATAGIQVLAGYINSTGINNQGSVSGSQYGIQLLSGATLVGGINNSGLIAGVNGSGIKLSSAIITGGITNNVGASISGINGQAIVIDQYSTVDAITNNGGYISGISNAGLISGANTAIRIISNAVLGGIYNSGTISGVSNGVIIKSSVVTGSITNTGLIQSGTVGESSIATLNVKNSSVSGGILNTGTIFSGIDINTGWPNGLTDGGQGIGVFNSSIGGDISNAGLIQSDSWDGVLIRNSKVTGSVNNTGTILGWTAGIVISNSTISGGIVNSGLLNSRGSSGTGEAGLYIAASNISGGVNNSGTIGGTGKVGVKISGIFEDIPGFSAGSKITGGITNSGAVIGLNTGIQIDSLSSISGGISNSGIISGGDNSIWVSNDSTLGGIAIAGNNTAQFIGDVYAPRTPVTITGGSTYTMGANFTVSGFNNGGILVANPGTAYTISGPSISGTISSNATSFTQGSVSAYRVGVDGTAAGQYGSIGIIGNATFGTASGIDVRLNNSTDGIGAGTVLGNIFNATNGITSSGFTVTDNSVLLSFAATVSGNQINVIASNSTACNGNVSTAITGPCLVGFDAPSLTVDSTGTISGGAAGIEVLAGYSNGGITNAGLVSGSQYGIQALSGATLAGGITNSGIISGATGIKLSSATVIGGINNYGFISASSSLGINVSNSSIAGNIYNDFTGTISGLAVAVNISNSYIDGNINNNGSIIGGATGVRMQSSTLQSAIRNNGIISGATVGMNLASSSIDGIENIQSGTYVGTIVGGNFGIYSYNNQVSNLANYGGTISGVSISGVAILDSTISNGLINTGNINGGQYGVYVGGSSLIYGDIDNSGVISGSNSGIYISSNSTINGAIVNYGGQIIGGISNAGYINAISAGITIWSNSLITGGINNSGTISAEAVAIGIYGSTIAGNINNSGLLKTGNYSFSTSPVAALSIIGSTVNGSVINTGSILSGVGSDTGGTGIVIANSNINGNISNAGLIQSDASLGVVVANSSVSGSVNNSGTILGLTYGSAVIGSTIVGGIVNTGLINTRGPLYGSAKVGLAINSSEISGGIVNTGTIGGLSNIGMQIKGNYGYTTSSASYFTASKVTGGITNSGLITGYAIGLKISTSATVIGGLTNSGVISGGNYSVYVDSQSSLDNIAIAGRNTAQFIGDVYAPSTPVSITGGAIYTMGTNFTVSGFNNDGILASAPGTAYTVTGFNGSDISYNQSGSGVFRVGVSTTGDYGSVGIIGGATFAGDTGIDVRFNNTTANIGNGTVLGNIFNATNGISATSFTVTDNSVLLDFTARVNGSNDERIDLTAFNSTACNTSVSGSVIGPCLVGFDAPSLTVATTGTISSTTAGIQVLAGYSNGTGINNQGSVGGSQYGIQVLSGATLVGGITNSGVIAGARGDNKVGIGIKLTSAVITGGITNNLGASITGINGAGIVIDQYSTVDGINNNGGYISGIINAGLVSGNDSAIAINGGEVGVISNFGTINGSIVISEATLDDLNNTGQITSANTGIRIASGSTVLGGIYNNGTISGGSSGSMSGNSYGIAVVSRSRVTGVIENDGYISGASGGIKVTAAAVGGIYNSGTIIGLLGGPGNASISLNYATVTGGINNVGLITANSFGLVVNNSNVAAGISNSGVINGGAIALNINNSYVAGGINNSGMISSDNLGININLGSVVEGIFNSGYIRSINNDGKIVGVSGIVLTSQSSMTGNILNNGLIAGTSGVAIDAQSNSPVSIVNNAQGTIVGAINSSNPLTNVTNSGLFALQKYDPIAGRIIDGTTVASLISGNYSQLATGTLQIGVNGTNGSGTNFGNYSTLNVSNTASFAGGTNLFVSLNSYTAVNQGDTLVGVISAGTLSATTFNVDDNSVVLNFNYGVVGSQVNLSATASGACAGTITTNTTGPCLVGIDSPSLQVNTGVTISGGSAGVQVLAGISDGTGINNQGAVRGNSYGIQMLSSAALLGGITNSGIIAGTVAGISMVNAALRDGLINNLGSSIIGNLGAGIVLDTGSTIFGGISNLGYISGISNAGLIGGVVAGIDIKDGTIGGIYNSGTITGSSYAIAIGGSGNIGANVTQGITNAGFIGNGSSGILVQSSAKLGGIYNSGVIAGGTYGVYVLDSSVVTSDIKNVGTISAWQGIHLSASSIQGSITNSGTISGVAAGINLVASGAQNIVNSGSISGSNGIYIAGNSTVNSQVINNGIINSSLSGIVVWNGSGIGNGIYNSGTISAGNAGAGIAVLANYSGASTGLSAQVLGGITNTGSIQAGYGIAISSSSIVGGIKNAGVINGGTVGVAIFSDATLSGGINNQLSGLISGAGGYYGVGIGISNALLANGITNAGTITGANTAINIYAANVTGVITNSGFISGSINGLVMVAPAYAGTTGGNGYTDARNSSIIGSIVNSGTIAGGVSGIQLSGEVDSYSTLSATANALLDGSINNSGLISGGTIGISLNLATLTGGISNQETIQGLYQSSATSYLGDNLGWGIHLLSGSLAGGVTNDGYIFGGNTGINLYNSKVVGDVSNTGLIEGLGGNNTYFSRGINIENTEFTGNIYNSGAGTIVGGTAGINLADRAVLTGDIVNYGLIKGTSTNRFDGSGIVISSNSLMTGSIMNAGTTTGVANGIGLYTNSKITGAISNSGLIVGATAITVVSSTVTGGIKNSGQIIGLSGTAISISSDSPIITISNTVTGTIVGAIVGNADVSNSGLIALQTLAGLFGSTIAGGSHVNSTISGNYMQAASGTLMIGVNGAGGTSSGTLSSNFSHLNVAGTASFASGSNIYVNMNSDSALQVGDSLLGVVTAGTTVSSTSLNVGDNSVLLAFTAVNTGTGLNLVTTLSGACAGTVSSNAIGPCYVGYDSPSLQVNLGVSITSTTSGIIVQSGVSNGASVSGFGINNEGNVIATNYGIQFQTGATLTGGITNSGTITASNGNGVYMYNASLSGGLNNLGNIAGITGIRIQGSQVSGGIRNVGTIVGSNGYGVFVTTNSLLAGNISNTGLIQGQLGGIFFNNSSISGNIDNAAGAIIDSSYSSSSFGLKLNQSTMTGNINNYGTISGNGAAIWLENSKVIGSINNQAGAYLVGNTQTGIAIQNGSTLTGSVVNNGYIQGVNSGIYLEQSSVGGDIVNNAGATIAGNYAGVFIVPGNTISGSIINNAGANIIGNYAGVLITGQSDLSSLTNAGVINGGAIGVYINSGATIAGGINNSGTIGAVSIGGAYASIYVSNNSYLPGGINILGTSAALNGDVFAQTANMNIKSGANFTNANAINVNEFNIESGAVFNLINAVSSLSTSSGGVGEISVASGQAVNNAGVLNIGTFTPTISGNFVQSNTGTFSSSIASQTNYGRLYVTGSASLSGTAYVNVLNPATSLAAGSTLVGVISAGTVNGTFAQVNTNSSNYEFNSAYTNNEFNLTIGQRTASSSNQFVNSVIQNNNPAAINAANVLQGFANNPAATPSMAPVVDRLDTIYSQYGGSAAQSNAISQTLPSLVGAGSQATAMMQQNLNQIMQGRQNQLRGLSSGEEYIGGREAWMKGFGSRANQDSVNNVSGYKVNTGGLAIGVDKALSPKSNMGAVFAFGNSSMSSNNSAAASGITINTYQLGVYGDTYIRPDLQINYQLDGGLNNNKEYRNLSSFNGVSGVGSSSTGVNANANYNSYSAHLGSGLKKFVNLGEKTTLIPSARVDYTTVRSQGYTENGAGVLNLTVNSQTYNMLVPSADFRIDQMLGEKLRFSVNAGAGYNLLNNQVQSTSAYQGGGSVFTTNGLQTSPWSYNGGLGLSGRISKEVELNVRYDTQFTTSGYNNQMVSGKIKIFY